MADKMQRAGEPIQSFRFAVEIGDKVRGRFQEVSGLSFELTVKEQEEGGLNTHIHRRPIRKKYPNIKLKRGYVNASEGGEFLKWFKDFIDKKSPGARQSGSIMLLDRQGNEIQRWSFVDAWPVKWEGPSANSGQDSIPVETLEIAHHGFWWGSGAPEMQALVNAQRELANLGRQEGPLDQLLNQFDSAPTVPNDPFATQVRCRSNPSSPTNLVNSPHATLALNNILQEAGPAGADSMNTTALAQQLTEEYGIPATAQTINGVPAVVFEDGSVFADGNGNGLLGTNDYNFSGAVQNIEERFGVSQEDFNNAMDQQQEFVEQTAQRREELTNQIANLQNQLQAIDAADNMPVEPAVNMFNQANQLAGA